MCKAAFPHVIHHVDVTKVTKADILNCRAKFPRLKKLLCGGGFPCRDMSRLRGHKRKGIQGEHSGLVVHLPRVWKLIEDFWPEVQLLRFAENVSSSM